MDFIDLDDVLKGIVACIPPRRYIPIPLPEKFKDGALVRDNALVMRARKFWIRAERTIDNARRFSEAAQKLNKALHDDAKPPQWMQFDKVKGFAVRADSISTEGLALLTHATGWEKRERKLSHEHVKDCTRNGWGPGTMHPARSTDDGLTPAGSYFRPREIGFDRAELLAFLDGKVTHSIESTAPAQNTATPAPVVAVVALVELGKAGSVDKATAKPATNWRMKIQAEAYKHWIELLASGCSPTPNSILDHLAAWCATNTVRTDTGIFPSAGYIKNTVINGRLWQQPTMSREQAKIHVAQVAQTKVAQVAQ